MNTASLLRTSLLTASIFVIGGCASNPLVGRWTSASTMSGAATVVNLTMNGDGTATLGLQVTGGSAGGMPVTCTGPGLTYAGITWMSTATSITFAGVATCTGMSTCMSGGMTINFDCASAMGGGMSGTAGSNNYTLTANNSILTFSSGNLNNQIFLRAN